jgi:ferredoxin
MLQDFFHLYKIKVVISLAYVITAPCVGEKFGECVDVCPVDCIVEGDDQFFIDPDICIDCGACQAVCPVEAIFHEEEMLPEDEAYLAKAKVFFAKAE